MYSSAPRSSACPPTSTTMSGAPAEPASVAAEEPRGPRWDLRLVQVEPDVLEVADRRALAGQALTARSGSTDLTEPRPPGPGAAELGPTETGPSEPCPSEPTAPH